MQVARHQQTLITSVFGVRRWNYCSTAGADEMNDSGVEYVHSLFQALHIPHLRPGISMYWLKVRWACLTGCLVTLAVLGSVCPQHLSGSSLEV